MKGWAKYTFEDHGPKRALNWSKKLDKYGIFVVENRDAKINLNSTNTKFTTRKLAQNVLYLNSHEADLFGRTS